MPVSNIDPTPLVSQSVITPPTNGASPYDYPALGLGSPYSGAAILVDVASAADTIAQWGINPRVRDGQLRAFWPTEHLLASAIFNTVARYVAFGWSLKGPPKTVGAVQKVFESCDRGRGWAFLMTKVLIDLLTQDNGAFIEVVRSDNSPTAPVVSLNHLDAARCVRTGRAAEPVVYIDIEGRYHRMAWYQIHTLEEFPSPIEEARGLQYCAVSRILRASQIMRDIHVLRHEKASGRFTRQIHLVSGIQTRVIDNAVLQHQANAGNQGISRYIQPLVVASLDPTAKVSKETIDLASVPDDFDEEKSFRNYIVALAMAFGEDYQDFAPLTGGSMGSGSSSQAKVLAMKSRGKGPALFMKMIERAFNFHGLMPNNIVFEFGDQDMAEEMEKTELRKARALERQVRIASGEITPEVARQMAVDDGDLDVRYLDMMRETNVTGDVTSESTEPVQDYSNTKIKPGTPGPKQAPGSGVGVSGQPNSNFKRNRAPSMDQKRVPGGTPEVGARP